MTTPNAPGSSSAERVKVDPLPDHNVAENILRDAAPLLASALHAWLHKPSTPPIDLRIARFLSERLQRLSFALREFGRAWDPDAFDLLHAVAAGFHAGRGWAHPYPPRRTPPATPVHANGVSEWPRTDAEASAP